MVGVSVIQEARAVRHTPLPPLLHENENATSSEDLAGDLHALSSPSPLVGGFVGGGQLAWRAVGPTVEIIETSTGTRKAAWTFGAILHNNAARVSSVCGVGQGSVSHVVVGVDLGADAKPQGLVALLSLYSSRLTRAFHFTHKVTSVVMVSGGEVTVDGGTLVSELRPWRGILVVGTAHGTLHLLDLALDLGGNKVVSDELSPGNLTRMVTPDPRADQTRRLAILQRSHPTMCLSDGMMCGGRFQLVGPDDNVLFEVVSRLVTVTALAFLPQLASLVVGYSFGAFQIINLSTLTIDCTSPYEENVPPVLSFACQEPENDPKNFVYLWLCRSWDPAESNSDSKRGPHALCTMYAMNYDNKVWIEGHGLWYQGLASISPRFEFDAVGGLGLRGQPAKPSVVFAATCVHHTTSTAATATGSVSALATPDEDAGSVPEQSLCMFGWVGGILEEGAVSINHYLAVFDINQWYQAHMPSNLKLEERRLCPYMSFHQLDRVPWGGDGGRTGQGEVVLGAAPRPASWARHTSRTCNDTDWFPAALSYDAFLLTSGGMVEYQCQSAQQAAVAFLTTRGPSAIVSPDDAHARCVFAGLLPTDPISLPTTSSMVAEREALLNVALDQQLASLLVQCVAEFSEGRFTALGCSLPALLDWAWGRVFAIKAANDTLCLPLFDSECGVVSTDNITSLHQNLTSLASLTTVITTIRDYAHINLITLQGAGELESRVQVVCLVRQHLGAVLWFYHCGLLSPGPSEDTPEEQPGGVPFPADLLSRIYHNRRLEIQRLSASLSGKEILMIDGLLDEAGGAGRPTGNGNIGQAWEEEGGSSIYPPPSLHALLSIFLLPDVSTTTKHRIVQYLFLDLASLLTDGYVRVVEELVKYPSSFSLSPSLIKLTQAFWLLDHKDFQEALNVLLDPLVNSNDLHPWQHRRIMKAFLYQGECGLALRYAQIRQPPKVDPDDIRLHLTLLLANGLIREAFHYQRTHRIRNNALDLLNHLFHGCEQLGKLESVIHLPLCPLEEEALVSYLHTSASTSAYDYLLVYYLQRAKYVEAASLQDSLRGCGLGIAKKRQGARTALVHGYLTHLPDVANKLSSGASRKTSPTHSTYVRPQPLSAQIRHTALSPKSRATTISRKFGRSSQDDFSPKQQPQQNTFTPFRSAVQRRRMYQATENQDIALSFSPKQKNLARDASHVVFPSRIEASHTSFLGEEEEGGRGETTCKLFSPMPARRSGVNESSLMRDGTLSMMESVLRRSMHGPSDASFSVSQSLSAMSAAMLSLLQTPKVKHRRKSVAISAVESNLIDTPQSILKVRQMVQRPVSPSAASDTSIPVFPKLSSKKATISVADDTLASKPSETSMTPKQLRFHLPKNQVEEEQAKRDLLEQSDVPMLVDDDDYECQLQEESELEEERTDIETERQSEAKDETGESGVFALPQSSMFGLKVSPYPLRHPNSGIPTPRLALHHSNSTAALSLPSDESRDEVDTWEADKEEESFKISSREVSATEMFYSFTEEEEEEEEMMEEEVVELKEKEEPGDKEHTEEEEEDIEEEDETGYKNGEETTEEVQDEGVVGDEEVEVESAERSKEIEESEDYMSHEEEGEDEKEEDWEDDSMDDNQDRPQEGTLTKMQLEISSVNKESRDVVKEVNVAEENNQEKPISRDVSNASVITVHSDQVKAPAEETSCTLEDDTICNETVRQIIVHKSSLNTTEPFELSDSESKLDKSIEKRSLEKEEEDAVDHVVQVTKGDISFPERLSRSQRKVEEILAFGGESHIDESPAHANEESGEGKEESDIVQLQDADAPEEDQDNKREREDATAADSHTISPREEKMIAEAMLEGQGEEREYTLERFSPLRFSDSENEEEEEEEDGEEEKEVEEEENDGEEVKEKTEVNKILEEQLENEAGEVVETVEEMAVRVGELEEKIDSEAYPRKHGQRHKTLMMMIDSEEEMVEKVEEEYVAMEEKVGEVVVESDKGEDVSDQEGGEEESENLIKTLVETRHTLPAGEDIQMTVDIQTDSGDTQDKECSEGSLQPQDKNEMCSLEEGIIKPAEILEEVCHGEVQESRVTNTEEKVTYVTVDTKVSEATEEREGKVPGEDVVPSSDKHDSTITQEVQEKEIQPDKEVDSHGVEVEKAKDSDEIEVEKAKDGDEIEVEKAKDSNEMEVEKAKNSDEIEVEKAKDSDEMEVEAKDNNEIEIEKAKDSDEIEIEKDKDSNEIEVEEAKDSSEMEVEKAKDSNEMEVEKAIDNNEMEIEAKANDSNEIEVEKAIKDIDKKSKVEPKKSKIPKHRDAVMEGKSSKMNLSQSVSVEHGVLTFDQESNVGLVSLDSGAKEEASATVSPRRSSGHLSVAASLPISSPTKQQTSEDDEVWEKTDTFIATSLVDTIKETLPQMTPTRRRRRSSLTGTPSGTTRDTEAKDTLTPLRRSHRISGASPATPITPKVTAKKSEAITPDKEAVEDGTPAFEIITRSGRKMRQVPVPVTKSRPSTPASVLTNTPVRRSRRLSGVEGVDKVTLKLVLSPEDSSGKPEAASHKSSTRESTSDVLPTPPVSPSTPTKNSQSLGESSEIATPTKSSARKSTHKSIVEDVLETISEEVEEESVSVVESQSSIKPKTPVKETPTKSSTGTRRKSLRRSIAAIECLEVISESGEVSPTNTSVLSSDPSTQSSTPTTTTTPTPTRRSRRRSGVGVEVASEPEETAATPSRRRRRSVGGGVALDDSPQVKTPRRKGETEAASKKGTPKSQTEGEIPEITRPDNIARRTRRQSQSEEEKGVARRTRRQSQSEEEKGVEVRKARTRHASSGSEATQNSPDSISARSVGSGSVTSIKDSESSEEEERRTGRKRSAVKRQGELARPGEREWQKPIHPVVSELAGRRKSRRLTVSSASITTMVDDGPKAARKSLKALRIYSDSDESSSTSILTPEFHHHRGRHSSRVSRQSHATSILLLGSPGEEEEEEEVLLQGGLDTDEGKDSEVQESPEMPLNLLKIAGGKRRRKSSLSRFSLGQAREAGSKVKRRSIWPHLVHSLKLHTEDSSQEPETEAVSDMSSTSRRPRKSVHKAANTTLLEIVPELQSQISTHLTRQDQESRVANTESECVSEEEKSTESKVIEKGVEENAIPQFQFAVPKSVVSSRKARALESLTCEAVEFLFSAPLTASRTVKHQTRAEESLRLSSSDSEPEGEPGREGSTYSRQK